jgi:hypothetical protein
MTRRHLHAVRPPGTGTVSYDWLETRDLAETVACLRCEAAIGVHCHNPMTGDELRAPAHFQRIEAASNDGPGTSSATVRPPSSSTTPRKDQV